jgi:hypothetical protein
LTTLATYEVDVDPELERAPVVAALVARLTG